MRQPSSSKSSASLVRGKQTPSGLNAAPGDRKYGDYPQAPQPSQCATYVRDGEAVDIGALFRLLPMKVDIQEMLFKMEENYKAALRN